MARVEADKQAKAAAPAAPSAPAAAKPEGYSKFENTLLTIVSMGAASPNAPVVKQAGELLKELNQVKDESQFKALIDKVDKGNYDPDIRKGAGLPPVAPKATAAEPQTAAPEPETAAPKAKSGGFFSRIKDALSGSEKTKEPAQPKEAAPDPLKDLLAARNFSDKEKALFGDIVGDDEPEAPEASASNGNGLTAHEQRIADWLESSEPSGTKADALLDKLQQMIAAGDSTPKNKAAPAEPSGPPTTFAAAFEPDEPAPKLGPPPPLEAPPPLPGQDGPKASSSTVSAVTDSQIPAPPPPPPPPAHREPTTLSGFGNHKAAAKAADTAAKTDASASVSASAAAPAVEEGSKRGMKKG
jgi:hypothetical protein